jgi:hypothetical protein
MATQISVNSATGNVTVNLSRTVIGQIVNANTANTANALNAASTANVVIGGGTNGYVLSTNGAGVTSWVAQTGGGGGGGTPGGSNTQVQYNDAGAFGGAATFTYDDTTDTLNVGTISATNIGNITPTNLDGNVANVLHGDGSWSADQTDYSNSNVVSLMASFGSNTILTTGLITGDGGGLSNIAGANVSGEVSFAATANSVAGANVSGEVSFAATANSVAGANVSGAVALATSATTANAVAGANVSGAVSFATTANSVAVANVSGIGNIATVNLDGNVANVLSGDGTFIAAGGGGGTYGDSNVVTLMGAFGSNTISTTGLITGDGGGLSNIAGANISGAVANATHATVADSANAVAGANVSGAVALATSATSANAVAYANVSGTPTLGNISTINIDGNVANVLRGDGSFAADANSSYGDSNVVTLLNAFGSNTISTTGLITGDGGGLSNIAGANVSGEVSFAATANAVAGANVSGEVSFAATANSVAGANVSGVVANATHSTISDSANSVAVANVSGIGNIATVNLDGNTANYLGGTGVWGPIAGGANANFANYAGNVTVSNQPNITQTGNLVSFTVDDAVANSTTHQIDPALITTPVSYSANKAQEVIEIWGDDNGGNQYGGNGTTTFLSNDITPGVPGYAPVVGDYAASNPAGGYVRTVREEKGLAFFAGTPGAGNVWGHGEIRWTIASSGADLDLANGGTNTTYSWSGDGLAVNTKTTTDSPALNFFGYGTDTSNAAVALGLNFSRRRGNNVARADIAAGDYLGDITWTGKKATGYQGQTARLGGRVSPAWDGTGNQIPTGVEIITTDASGGTHTTEFGDDGDSFFPGNLTLNNSGIFTGDGGGLSNIAGANVSGLGNIVNTNLDGNSANYLGGTGVWGPALGSPGGSSGTIQFNNSGTLDGDNRFQFNPTGGYGTQPQITLEGQPNNVPGIFNINNSVLAMNTENLSGGYAPMSFSTYNTNPYMEPIVYYRARGTRSVPTAVVAGDIIKNERIQCYSAPGGFPLTNAQAGSVTSTVQANDGLGNIAASYTISTAKPANGPNSLDKIVLDTEYVQAIGNIEMTTKSAVFAAGLVQQPSYLFANLPSGISAGTRSFISDGATVTFRGAAAGGGTDFAPVFFDGGVWRYG